MPIKGGVSQNKLGVIMALNPMTSVLCSGLDDWMQDVPGTSVEGC